MRNFKQIFFLITTVNTYLVIYAPAESTIQSNCDSMIIKNVKYLEITNLKVRNQKAFVTVIFIINHNLKENSNKTDKSHHTQKKSPY